MDEILGALADQHAEFAAVIAPLDEAGWQTQSACPGWSIADVVLHLVQTDELAFASARGEFEPTMEAFGAGLGPAADIDEGAALAVARDRGETGAAIGARWATTSARMHDAFAERAPADRVQWVAGDMAARTLATTRLSECWIHTEDIAAPLGVDVPPTDRLWNIARLAWRTLPYAFAGAGLEMAGPITFDLVGPGGDAWRFEDGEPETIVTGSAVDLCRVAGQRLGPDDVGLTVDGADAGDVLRLVRTFA